MPSPVDALPCGSRSMISTCSPIAASAVPRLIAVVVLPTPPFWFAIAITRGGRALGMRARGTTCGVTASASAVSVMTLHPGSSVSSFALSDEKPIFHSPENAPDARIVCNSMVLPAARQIPDEDDTSVRIGAARHEINLNSPCFGGLAELKLCILPLRGQDPHAGFPLAFSQERKALIKQQVEWRERAGG